MRTNEKSYIYLGCCEHIEEVSEAPPKELGI